MASKLNLVSQPSALLAHTRSLPSEGPMPLADEPHIYRNAGFPSKLLSSTPASQSLQQRRSSSKSTLPGGVESMPSALNMQDNPPSQQDASSAAMNEKKRNKLGYHRTSVACVHCRRRKIRCLVAPDDSQGRCQNCIRLKKECNFYPVDQQPSNERQRRSVARGSSQTSTSPGPSNGPSPDQYNQYPPMPIAQAGYPPPLQPIHSGTMPMAPIETGSFQPPLRSATWDPGYMESPLSAGPQMSDAGTPGFWPKPSPVEGAYLPYGSQSESARSAQFPSSFVPSRSDSWATPSALPSHASTPGHPVGQAQQRSMSLQHDGPAVYGGTPMQGNQYYDGRGPPSLYASTGSPATSTSLSDGTSAPGPAQPAMHYHMSGTAWDPNKQGMEFAPGAGWYPEQAGVPGDGWPPQGQSGFEQEQG